MEHKISFTTIALIGVAAASRTFDFINYCNEPVWFGFAGGATSNVSNTGTLCNSDADCYQGTKCIQTGAISQCFFQNPTPANGDFKLETGSSNSVSIPIYTDANNAIWSGAMTGRTGCDSNGMNCATADCGGSQCIPSRGFNQPATQAEMTLLKNTVDFYDIEIINGVSIGVSMTPTNAAGWSGNPYDCGNPGSKFPRSSMIGAATWSFSPPSDEYNWVTAGGAACTSSSQCGGELCGYSFNPGHNPLLQMTCGTRLGYWSADELCGIQQSLGAPFNCSTNWDLLACVGGVGSCYQQGANTSCCGCVNWWTVPGITSPPSPYTNACVNTNPYWNSTIQPMLQWLKEACPSCYTYPYDDMSSTFTCQAFVGNVNSVNYEIAFCPENKLRANDELE